jgi:hypothetical protein
MHQIQYAGHTVQCKNNETILECLIRSGLNIDFSCKSGVCHRCMLKCTTGEIPEHATKNSLIPIRIKTIYSPVNAHQPPICNWSPKPVMTILPSVWR